MKVIADHQGAGGGSVEFGDDPRMDEFLVEPSGIDWSVSVLETFAPRTLRLSRNVATVWKTADSV